MRRTASAPLIEPTDAEPAENTAGLEGSTAPEVKTGPSGAPGKPQTEPGPVPWHVIRRSLGLFAVGRVLIVVTVFVISAVDHLSPSLLFRTWDGKYYTYLTHFGYPTTQHLRPARPDAFFLLYPVLGHLVHDVTRLPWMDADILVGWLGGATLVTFGALLANDTWGSDRAMRAAVVLAVFPGSVVSGLVYADPLGLAFVAATLYLLGRRRYVVAGVTGMAAAMSFSLALAPLLLVAAWLFFVKREGGAFVTGALTGLGAAIFFGYLWVHVGTPFIWFRLQRAIWHSHVGVSLKYGTWWAIQSNAWAGPITTICLVIAIAGLLALWKTNAPPTWLVFTGAVVAISLFDTGTWLTPRLVYAMFPGLLALGSRVPRRWLNPLVIVSLVCLVLCTCIYIPQNWLFFNP